MMLLHQAQVMGTLSDACGSYVLYRIAMANYRQKKNQIMDFPSHFLDWVPFSCAKFRFRVQLRNQTSTNNWADFTLFRDIYLNACIYVIDQCAGARLQEAGGRVRKQAPRGPANARPSAQVRFSTLFHFTSLFLALVLKRAVHGHFSFQKNAVLCFETH